LGFFGKAGCINAKDVAALLIGSQEIAFVSGTLKVFRLFPELVLEVVLQRIYIFLGLKFWI